MVNLEISGCCDGCEYIDLNLRKFGDDYWVKCEHQDVCIKLAEENYYNKPMKRSVKE